MEEPRCDAAPARRAGRRRGVHAGISPLVGRQRLDVSRRSEPLASLQSVQKPSSITRIGQFTFRLQPKL
jgi:hypothetical protein